MLGHAAPDMTGPSSTPTRHAQPRTGFRPDVQGLRALAVILVVGFHLYPDLLPGGYVGVDVFFVISGFLITGHLTKQFLESGRIRLLEFYGRRARRLLPAAVLVLVVTWIGSRLLLPITQVPAAATQIRASALYIQNWVLAANSVDYLAENQAPSPVQHYWSLSVEEQFYLLWPLLFIAAFVAALWSAARAGLDTDTARHRGVRIATIGAIVIVAGSLWFCVYQTGVSPASAYFITPTRLWELGIGGLLSLLYPAISRWIGHVGIMSWVGLAAVLGSAVLMTGATAFPGWIALIPTLGAALMIVCGSPDAAYGTATLTSMRPAVFIGDLSYSIYLWHWPLIVLWGAYSGGTIGALDGPAIAITSVILAWLTKIVIEDPFRHASWIAGYPRRSLTTVAAAIVPVALATGFLVQANPSPSPWASASAQVASAPDDLALANTSKCKATGDQTAVVSCVRGDTADPSMTIALVGDSFAAEWSSALIHAAERNGWKVVTVTHDSCPWTAQMLTHSGSDDPYTACHTWGKKALDFLVDTVHPDVVVTSYHPGPGIPGAKGNTSEARNAIARGMATYWRQLADAGIFVVGIHPTPYPRINIPDCLASRTKSIADCTVPASKAIDQTTAIDAAVAALGPSHAAEIDFNGRICTDGKCPPEIGGDVVYRDEKHLTKTFSLSLAPLLADKLESLVT